MVLGFVGTACFAGVLALVGVLLSVFDLIDLSGRLSVPVVAAIAGISAVAGAMVGILLVRKTYYRPRLKTIGKELTAAKERIESLMPFRDASRRHEAYARHIHLLLMELRGNGIESEEESLLMEPAKIMEEAIGSKVYLSVWSAPRDQTSRNNLRWTIECSPEHTERQRQEFAVPLKDSWIWFTQNLQREDENEKRNTKDFVFGLSDLSDTSSEGRDLTVFTKYEFRSLRFTSVVSDDCPGDDEDTMRYLVAVAEEPHVFDETEDWYIIFLGQILGLHHRMTPPSSSF